MVLKSIVKDITKRLPLFESQKNMAFLYIEQRFDELTDKIRTAIENILKNELAKVLNK